MTLHLYVFIIMSFLKYKNFQLCIFSVGLFPFLPCLMLSQVFWGFFVHGLRMPHSCVSGIFSVFVK